MEYLCAEIIEKSGSDSNSIITIDDIMPIFRGDPELATIYTKNKNIQSIKTHLNRESNHIIH
jgi:hypothetical protein